MLAVDAACTVARGTFWRTEDTAQIISLKVSSRNAVETDCSLIYVLATKTVVKDTRTYGAHSWPVGYNCH